MLRAVRPDVIVPQVTLFVAHEMGARFIEPPPFDLMACFGDSNCATPLIFVLTPGADPMTELFKAADELGYSGKRLRATPYITLASSRPVKSPASAIAAVCRISGSSVAYMEAGIGR